MKLTTARSQLEKTVILTCGYVRHLWYFLCYIVLGANYVIEFCPSPNKDYCRKL